MEVKKIRKEGDQMKITIPKHSKFKPGDYVAIVPVQIQEAVEEGLSRKEHPSSTTTIHDK